MKLTFSGIARAALITGVLFAGGVAGAEGGPPANGVARDDPNTRAGFRAYFAPLRIWLEPDVFWYRWADQQKAFLWNGGREAPDGPEVEEGNMVILENDEGPCLLVRKGGRWRKAGEVFGWGERLRQYGGCATLTLEAE
ncbi:MAG: hypothetical protein AAFX85_17215 [Pseudomonadota bacterium]